MSRPFVSPDPPLGLSEPQRRARGLARVLASSASPPQRSAGRVRSASPSLAAGWLGASHLAAAAIGYRGCPELGAIPTLLLGRRVETRCGPWERLDARLGLETPRNEGEADAIACAC